jgi:DNA polymerase I-like protein with 3'-5' exonuclease and polymerase domains
MATIHPAFALRVPSHQVTLAEDIKRFGRYLNDELEVQDVQVRMVTTERALRKVCELLATKPLIAYDTEDRYVPWVGKEWKIVCLGLSGDGECTYVIPLYHPDSPFRKKWRNLLRTYVKPVLEREDVKLVAQSGKHDNVQLAGAGVFVEHTFDIMLAAHLLDENRPKNLGYLSQSILGADVYKGMVELKPDKILEQDLRTLCLYNGYDVGYTWQLYQPLKDELKKHPRLGRLFVKLMMPASHTIQRVEYRGWYVDKDRLIDRMEDLQDMIDERLSVLAEYGFTGNPNSPVQLSKWLYSRKHGLGLDPIEQTRTGNNSTREGVLLHYRDHPAIRALLRYRTLQLKWMSTYLLPWSEKLDDRSRLHTSYKLYGTVTGRLSGDMQQVPRDPFIRSILGAPRGWCFIQADYSQIELRIAAHIAHERRMMRAFNVGEDLHMATAMTLTGKPMPLVTKEERKKAKAVNFGYLYGMYPKKFQSYAFESYNLKVSMAEAEVSRERYFRLFPDLSAWHTSVERLVKTRGYVQSPLGRVRHLPDVYSSDGSVAREAVRQAINSPVQATASDLMLFAMTQLDQVLDERECFMVGTLHDGIFFECREDKVDKWLPVIKDTMENLPLKRTFGVELSIPVVADVEASTHWSEDQWQEYDPEDWITWA